MPSGQKSLQQDDSAGAASSDFHFQKFCVQNIVTIDPYEFTPSLQQLNPKQIEVQLSNNKTLQETFIDEENSKFQQGNVQNNEEKFHDVNKVTHQSTSTSLRRDAKADQNQRLPTYQHEMRKFISFFSANL